MATDVSAPFPDVDLEEQSIITVALGDPLAKITRVVMHFTQDVPEDAISVEPFLPLFTYGRAQ
jgi:hypothetical protein